MYVAAPEEAVVLAVGYYQLTQPRRLCHGFPHHVRILYSSAVIGKCDGIVSHGSHGHQLPSHFSGSDGSVRIHRYDCVPVYNILLYFQGFRTVRHGIQVWHGAHCRKSACRRCPAAGSYSFFIRKSRFSEMHVYIAKTGKNIIFLMIKLSDGLKGVVF